MGRFWDAVNEWLLFLSGLAVAMGSWAVRRILTNEKEIELMKKSLENTNQSVEMAHKRLDQQHEESVLARKELKEAIDTQSQVSLELLRYLRDNK